MKKILVLLTLLLCLTGCTTTLSLNGSGKLVIMDVEIKVYSYSVDYNDTEKTAHLVVQFANESDYAKTISISEVKAINKKNENSYDIKYELDQEFGNYLYYTECAYYDFYLTLDNEESLDDFKIEFAFSKFTVRINLEERQ